MPQGGVYRIDPPPVQPGPFVPIPAQGDFPPFVGRSLATLGLLVSSWQPGPLLPVVPNRNYIAPLTLTYGDQPPVVSGQRDIDIQSQVVSTAWQLPDPLPTIPNRRYIAPLTLTYGDKPPPAPHSVNDKTILGYWEPPAPLPTIPQRNYDVPLTLTYGDQPPVVSSQRDIDVQSSVLAMAWEPGPPLPTIPQRRFVAPLTLSYGDQPPFLNRQAIPYQSVDYNQPQRSFFAPLIPVIVAAQPAYTRLPQWIIDAWQPATIPVQKLVGIAPLTLTYGNQPPPYSTVVNGKVILGQWETPAPLPTIPQRSYIVVQTLTYGDQPPRLVRQFIPTVDSFIPQQQRSGIASLIPPVSVQPPFTRLPNWIIDSWKQVDQPTFPRNNVAPLALTYGDRPPPLKNTIPLQADTYFPQQARAGVASFAVTVVSQVPFVAQPSFIVNSWNPAPFSLPPSSKIAPLTLTYGSQPPKLRQQNIPYWDNASPQQSQSKIAPLVSGYVPFTVIPRWILDSWQPAFVIPSRYPFFPLGGTSTIAATWRCRVASEIDDSVKLFALVGDVRRFAFDFGDIEEIANGQTITAATITGSGFTTSGQLIGSYRVSAAFICSTAGDLSVTCTATLSGGGSVQRTEVLSVSDTGVAVSTAPAGGLPSITGTISGVWRCGTASELLDGPRLYGRAGEIRRLAFDLGDVEEIVAGETITAASINGTGFTTTGIAASAYRVAALFTISGSGTRTVLLTVRLSGGGTVTRQGVLVIT